MYYCFSELIFDYLHGITLLKWRCKSRIIKGYRTCGRGKITNNDEARMGGTGSGYGADMERIPIRHRESAYYIVYWESVSCVIFHGLWWGVKGDGFNILRKQFFGHREKSCIFTARKT